MIIDDLVQYANEDNIRGEYARELLGVISDYQNKKITVNEKNELIETIKTGMEASELASDEKNLRWAVAAAEMVVSLI